MSGIKDFELISHGFMNENQFEEGPASPFQKILTGRGINEIEAFNDVVEQIKSTEGLLDLSSIEIEAGELDDEYYDPPFQSVSDGDEDEEGFGFAEEVEDGDTWFFYSIKYNLKK
jgi:hypothetical protein